MPGIQTARVAANCIRTLLLQPQPTVADRSIARWLLPRLIAFVTNTEPEDPEHARSLISHTLTLYVASLPKAKVPVAMALVIPAVLARAANEEGEEDEVEKETSARLLELAGVDQAAFRGVVGGMNESQRAFMESVIRAGRETGGQKRVEEGGQPSIALKMDFGG